MSSLKFSSLRMFTMTQICRPEHFSGCSTLYRENNTLRVCVSVHCILNLPKLPLFIYMDKTIFVLSVEFDFCSAQIYIMQLSQRGWCASGNIIRMLCANESTCVLGRRVVCRYKQYRKLPARQGKSYYLV